MLASLPLRFLDPEGDEARRWAVEELSKAKYQEPGQSLVERLGTWLIERLQQLNLDVTFNPSATGSIAIIIFLLVVGGFALYYGRLRPGARKKASGPSTILDDSRPLDRLEQDAAAALRAGNYASACADYYRASIRILDERGLILATPGMTAVEAAWQGNATTGLPLGPGAQLFDSVVYGGGSATLADAQAMADLANRCRQAGRVVNA